MPGIEPVPTVWQTSILPLNHRCKRRDDIETMDADKEELRNAAERSMRRRFIEEEQIRQTEQGIEELEDIEDARPGENL
ncbi:unnamed protein product [Heligmosomoides polygyrus]|uniref:MFAP1 domain-containing protein n=1 Tax=Heligmosomoides polygyrus TaxID=6339 RepID=A0A183G4A1_HELPZ|nr:unnamed protein product [Heligmosomoides polygyrus]